MSESVFLFGWLVGFLFVCFLGGGFLVLFLFFGDDDTIARVEFMKSHTSRKDLNVLNI